MHLSPGMQRLLTDVGFKVFDLITIHSKTDNAEIQRLEARQQQLEQLLAYGGGRLNTPVSSPRQDTSRAISSSSPLPAARKATPAPTPGASDLDTLKYQLDHLRDPLRQIELHLAEGCQIKPGVGCDCCLKSLRDIRTFAQETIPIAARQGKDPGIFAEMVDWARSLEPVTTVEASSSGEYRDLYLKESGTASRFRKAVEALTAECQPCQAAATARQAELRAKVADLAHRVQAGEISIDQAKAEAKALAQKEV